MNRGECVDSSKSVHQVNKNYSHQVKQADKARHAVGRKLFDETHLAMTASLPQQKRGVRFVERNREHNTPSPVVAVPFRKPDF